MQLFHSQIEVLLRELHEQYHLVCPALRSRKPLAQLLGLRPCLFRGRACALSGVPRGALCVLQLLFKLRHGLFLFLRGGGLRLLHGSLHRRLVNGDLHRAALRLAQHRLHLLCRVLGVLALHALVLERVLRLGKLGLGVPERLLRLSELPVRRLEMLSRLVPLADRLLQIAGRNVLGVHLAGEVLPLLLRHGKKPQSIGNTDFSQRWENVLHAQKRPLRRSVLVVELDEAVRARLADLRFALHPSGEVLAYLILRKLEPVPDLDAVLEHHLPRLTRQQPDLAAELLRRHVLRFDKIIHAALVLRFRPERIHSSHVFSKFCISSVRAQFRSPRFSVTDSFFSLKLSVYHGSSGLSFRRIKKIVSSPRACRSA